MESVMNIRRTFNSLLHSMHVLTHVKMSQLSQRVEGELFVELLRMLHFYARFEVDELTGEALSEQEMTKRYVFSDIFLPIF
jgi:intron-binding protein aquarius